MTDLFTPTCFNPAEELVYYFEELAEQAELEELQELEQTPISTNRELQELPLPLWLLDEGHDLPEPLEVVEALEVAA